MCTRARCLFARFSRLELSAPLVEASPGHPELLRHLIDALASPHTLYGHPLKLPRITLSSLHSSFLSRRVCPSRVCQFKGSLHLTPTPVFQSTCFASSQDHSKLSIASFHFSLFTTTWGICFSLKS